MSMSNEKQGKVDGAMFLWIKSRKTYELVLTWSSPKLPHQLGMKKEKFQKIGSISK
jgi:hypothetical protein